MTPFFIAGWLAKATKVDDTLKRKFQMKCLSWFTLPFGNFLILQIENWKFQSVTVSKIVLSATLLVWFIIQALDQLRKCNLQIHAANLGISKNLFWHYNFLFQVFIILRNNILKQNKIYGTKFCKNISLRILVLLRLRNNCWYHALSVSRSSE